MDRLTELLLQQHDESFRAGAVAVIESLEKSFDDWRLQVLFRIAPKWALRQIKTRFVDVLPSAPQAGEVPNV